MKQKWWSGTSAGWNESVVTLPSVDVRADLMLQRWCVVAGGLALILSRLGETERRSRFASTQWLYQEIRRALMRSDDVPVNPELIGDVMHEIAQTADGLTRQCLKACFEAALHRQPSAGLGKAGRAATPVQGNRTSALVSQPRPSRVQRE